MSERRQEIVPGLYVRSFDGAVPVTRDLLLERGDHCSWEGCHIPMIEAEAEEAVIAAAVARGTLLCLRFCQQEHFALWKKHTVPRQYQLTLNVRVYRLGQVLGIENGWVN